jgi:hypothetical protein
MRMAEESVRIRREVSALGPRRRGARIPGTLRGAIGAYARRERAKGVALGTIAAAVGVSKESIRRWVTATRSRRLLPVVVRDAVVDGPGVTVIAPGGYRVEPLTLAQAAELLRRLA